VYPHEASDLEAIVPARIGGRDLIVWSIRGETMMDLLDADPAAADQLTTELVASGHDLNDFAQVIAGRADTDRDPPYFVYAFEIPEGSSQTAELMALAAVGFSSVPKDVDLETRTVGGKKVLVGSSDMVRQDEHSAAGRTSTRRRPTSRSSSSPTTTPGPRRPSPPCPDVGRAPGP
jgi:hypothetical protein